VNFLFLSPFTNLWSGRGERRKESKKESKKTVIMLPLHELRKDVERKERFGIRFFPRKCYILKQKM
jgi:hypothetical protein